jgi:hypothetical protein
MSKPARFPRLEFTSIKPPRKGATLLPAPRLVSSSTNVQSERKRMEHELRGARLTPRERRKLLLDLESLA